MHNAKEPYGFILMMAYSHHMENVYKNNEDVGLQGT